MNIYGDSEWRINISNIRYNGYINKWDVKYQIDGQNSWNTSEDLSFIVNEEGIYHIYIENGDVKSDETKKALGVPEPTPEVAEGVSELNQMLCGVIEVEFLEGTGYQTTQTANTPILREDMKAVYWGNASGEIDETITNNTNEFDSTDTAYKEQNWYNYESQETNTTENSGTSRWANAIVTVDEVDSYFVWIPRYAYRIIYFKDKDSEDKYRAGNLTEEDALNQHLIVGYSDARGIVNAEGKRPEDVASQTAISVNDKYFKTHPVFDGDVNYGGWAEDDGTPVKLQGIWVAKYEASSVEGNSNNEDGDNVTTKHIKIQPKTESWRNIIIGNMFTNAKNYNQNLNSHLMKNSEWGAVSYLTESKYGRNGTEIAKNNSGTSYITGTSGGTANASSSDTTYEYNTEKGGLASTTGNIYGIYDLSGGAWEHVAGYYNGNDANLDYGTSFAGKNKASDAYSTVYEGIIKSSNYIYGDATYETSFWNNDSNRFVAQGYPFFRRGGLGFNEESGTGVFSFDNVYRGDAYSFIGFRVCLSLQ